tara:strand:- start:36 stop:218 length:183 start_codon:yes stop_codon:yes gene_type:complete
MSYITDIADAILSIKNNSKFTVRGENKDTKTQTLNDCEIEWDDGETPISKTDIQTEMEND